MLALGKYSQTHPTGVRPLPPQTVPASCSLVPPVSDPCPHRAAAINHPAFPTSDHAPSPPASGQLPSAAAASQVPPAIPGLPLAKNLSPVGQAFLPAGSGGFPAPSWSDGLESPPNRQPGKAALRGSRPQCAVGAPWILPIPSALLAPLFAPGGTRQDTGGIQNYRNAAPDYGFAIPNYMTAMATNGFAMSDYRNATPDGGFAMPNYVTAMATNGLAIADYRNATADDGFAMPNYVTAIATNGLATPDYMIATSYNGLAMPDYMTAMATNGPATPLYRNAEADYGRGIPNYVPEMETNRHGKPPETRATPSKTHEIPPSSAPTAAHALFPLSPRRFSRLPLNRRPVGQAFLPAGSGGFPAPSWSGGLESPPNRQPGKAALRGSRPHCAVRELFRLSLPAHPSGRRSNPFWRWPRRAGARNKTTPLQN